MLKVLKENIVIDVIETPVWVSYFLKNKIFVSTLKQFARGVVSSDGEVTFHIEGMPKEGFEDYTTVSIVEITDEEASEIKAILEANEQGLIEQLQEELGVDEVPEEQILPRAPLMELQAMVQVLVDKVDILEDENIRLKEIIEAGGGVSNE